MKEEFEIITLDENERYILVDNVELEGKKYYLANKVDENNELLPDSQIFEEEYEDNERYMIVLEDEQKYNYLSSLFLENFNNLISKED